jgi:hypothetical protein
MHWLIDMLKLDRERADLLQQRVPRYGYNNPDQAINEFWDYMIRARKSAYWANQNLVVKIKRDRNAQHQQTAQSGWRQRSDGPTWCFTRFGRTVTQLADGRVVYVGGEHEDWYDDNFCIYSDVVVEQTDGTYDIYIYPKDVFLPTDSHSATLVGNHLYLIGSTG